MFEMNSGKENVQTTNLGIRAGIVSMDEDAGGLL